MELIKIEYPDMSLCEGVSELTEEQCDKLFEALTATYSSDREAVSAISEAALIEMNEELAQLAVSGGAFVLLTIYAIIKWIKNKYRLTARKLLDQSKEVNDIYTKVSDLLKNDKMARFKHRNDKVDTYFKYCVMRYKKDPRKLYRPMIDFVAYDPQYFINEINSIMNYVNTQSKDKKTDLANMKQSIMDNIDKGFEQYHGFVDECEPIMKIETIRGIRLEDAINKFKTYISNIYNTLYTFNQYISGELQYMQVLEKAYKKMLADWGKDKDGKALVDDIFKKLLANTSKSLDFNSSMMVIFNEEIKFYAEEMTRFYNIIKS